MQKPHALAYNSVVSVVHALKDKLHDFDEVFSEVFAVF